MNCYKQSSNVPIKVHTLLMPVVPYVMAVNDQTYRAKRAMDHLRIFQGG